jgi:uncharacterized protein YceK
MLKRLPIIAIAFLTLLGSGCGTVANTVWFIPEEGGKRVYGGVKVDLQVAREALERPVPGKPLAGLWCLIDLPFSLVGDTITLPYTIPYPLGWTGESSIPRTPAKAPSGFRNGVESSLTEMADPR